MSMYSNIEVELLKNTSSESGKQVYQYVLNCSESEAENLKVSIFETVRNEGEPINMSDIDIDSIIFELTVDEKNSDESALAFILNDYTRAFWLDVSDSDLSDKEKYASVIKELFLQWLN